MDQRGSICPRAGTENENKGLSGRLPRAPLWSGGGPLLDRLARSSLRIPHRRPELLRHRLGSHSLFGNSELSHELPDEPEHPSRPRPPRRYMPALVDNRPPGIPLGPLRVLAFPLGL